MKTFKSGERYGNWVVLNDTTCMSKDKVPCKCSCGVTSAIVANALTRGKSTMCRQCAHQVQMEQKRSMGKEDAFAMNPKKIFKAEYNSWSSMRNRCHGKTLHKDYGGRGVSVCREWRDSFINFLRDMGCRPGLAYTLERVDVNGDYTPQNCVWATRSEQSRNRRDSLYIMLGEHKVHVRDLVEIHGLKYFKARELILSMR